MTSPAIAYRRALPRLDDRVKVGGLAVSPFCLGIVDDPRTIPAAFDAGVNFFFFSADMHWPVYEAHRRGLTMLLERRRSIRDEIVVAIVSYVTQGEFCFKPFDEALAAVPKLGRIDLTVIGGAYASDFFARLERYKTHRTGAIAGTPTALGATFHDRVTAAGALEHDLVDIAFCRYNSAHRGAETEVFPRRRRGQKSRLYSFKSIHGWIRPERLNELGLTKDVWRPDVTDYYRYALAPRAIDGLLCSVRTRRQLNDLARALERGPLTTEEREHIHLLATLDAGRASLRETKSRS